MRRGIAALLVVGLSVTLGAQARQDPVPKTLEAFRSAVKKVLDETGVPGAGLALVRQSGVEWAGGIGFADRDRKTPFGADTRFPAGSISKTFVAMALVQLAQDDELDLDAPVAGLAPQVDIDNPWNSTDPVRVIHLLQHTAGFDDMHFNEAFNLVDPPDMPLEEVLNINPRSRIVRWKPGTRMSYSNPGYTVAGFVLEQATGQKFEDVIQQKILDPAGMLSSGFVQTNGDEPGMAKGYDKSGGPPVTRLRTYLRPSGNLETTAADLGKFVLLLLNWGETPEQLIVDPEYLSNMEHPRTTLASAAGLRNGYGSGIFAKLDAPFPLLGHDGATVGYLSSFAYSPARDVGFVVLLNASYAADAMARISSLAIRYLKADVDPPEQPRAKLPQELLQQYEGYYVDAAPRVQAAAFAEWLASGRTVTAVGDTLRVTPVFGKASLLVPMSDNLFRTESAVDATHVFTTDEHGGMVLTGPSYAERRPRWRMEIIRSPVLASCGVLLTPVFALLGWIVHARRAEPGGFWWLKASLLLCSAAALAPVVGTTMAAYSQYGTLNVWTMAIFMGSVTLPVAGLMAVFFTVDAIRHGAGRWLRTYAVVVSLATLVASAYFYSWGVVGFRPWNF